MTKYIIRGGQPSSPPSKKELTFTAGTGRLTAANAYLRSGYGQVFDVTSANGLAHGAHGDGVTDDSLHIQAAFLAAHNYSKNGLPSVVNFPTDTYAVGTSWLMPTIKTGNYLQTATGPEVIGATQRTGHITVEGNNSTIKFINSDRVGFLQAGWPTSYWDTHGKFTVQNFIFDNNDKYPTGSTGRIVWMTGNGNVEDVTVRNCTMTANLDPFDHVNDNHIDCIEIISSRTQADRSINQWGFHRNITIDNCNLKNAGGKDITILVNTPTTSPLGNNKFLIDNILINGVTADLNHYSGSNIHVGSFAQVRNVTISNCTCTDSTDDGIEINNVQNLHIIDCNFYNHNFPMMLTWFGYPPDAGIPQIHVSGCIYNDPLGDYHLDGAVQNDCQPYFFRAPTIELGAELWTRAWGDITIENCELTYGFDETVITTRNNFIFQAPWNSVTLNNIKITEPGSSKAYFNLNCTKGPVVNPAYHIHNITHRHVEGGTFTPVSASDFVVSGTHTMDTDVPGLT